MIKASKAETADCLLFSFSNVARENDKITNFVFSAQMEAEF